jgi:aspartyl-tRNA(Asn)/glutamyl-tRNA(Gln) amidotransferase subunit A
MARAWFLREEMLRALTRFQARHDLLLTPTTPCVAWPLDRLGPETIEGKAASPRGHAVFTPIFNHTFVPACSVPCDVAPDGLPIGLQIVGRRYEDELVLAAASAIETAGGARHAKPRRVAVRR